MKYMIVTDIHGSKFYMDKIYEIFKTEKADKLIILGDLYYHGPRNPLPKGYAPMEVANLLNSISDKLLVVKGNCDSEVDKMISDFDFKRTIEFKLGDRNFYFTHGHIFNKDNLPHLKSGDVMVYGHFHINEITDVDGVTAVNLSSVSMPKNGSESAYAILTQDKIEIKNLDGKVIMGKKFSD